VGADPLQARGYDGAGIVRTPDDRIGFWTDQGFRVAVAARVRYLQEGRVATFRLDSGEYHTEWGRLFLDACIPKESGVRVFFATSDELPDGATLDPAPPPNVDPDAIVRPELTPPLLPLALAPDIDEEGHALHRRETGRELPWARMRADDPFETYEVPVIAPPGRYLWITLELRGNGRVSPRIRCLRAEHPSHDLLRRLPKAFSRDEAVASFLRRYLAILDGALGDLEGRAERRSVLLDPYASPEEALPWLASFLGLTLDETWPEAVRRRLIDEAPALWTRRGTVGGLSRFLEIVVGRPPSPRSRKCSTMIGGALLTDEASTLFSGAVLGFTFRVGGAVGTAGEAPLAGEAADAFETHAHRFSVVIPALLDAGETAAVQHILEEHRPAHTVVDVCTVRVGMRVGIGLHVGLLSVIGRTGGWEPLQVGGSLLGRDAVVGRPGPGARLGVERLGRLRLG
jgi:phage tail-like protein